jgi:DNA-binding CsgD family transcriptional regulator
VSGQEGATGVSRTGSGCRNCGGPISPKNETGYCVKSHECRSMGSAARRQSMATRQGRKQPGKLIPEVRDVDTNELIIDDVAIHVALSGQRTVSLTETERRIVVRSLLLRHMDAKEIAQHLGVKVETAKQVIREVTANAA